MRTRTAFLAAQGKVPLSVGIFRQVASVLMADRSTLELAEMYGCEAARAPNSGRPCSVSALLR